MTRNDTFQHKHVLIAGRVQGVSFRYNMCHVARQLGVVGWCRNLPNGQVEAQVQGPADAIEKLLTWCHEGPPHAKVSQVTIQDLPNEMDHPGDVFEIRP